MQAAFINMNCAIYDTSRSSHHRQMACRQTLNIRTIHELPRRAENQPPLALHNYDN